MNDLFMSRRRDVQRQLLQTDPPPHAGSAAVRGEIPPRRLHAVQLQELGDPQRRHLPLRQLPLARRPHRLRGAVGPFAPQGRHLHPPAEEPEPHLRGRDQLPADVRSIRNTFSAAPRSSSSSPPRTSSGTSTSTSSCTTI
ncbi:MAG: hypothetical protein MZU97_06810 [Bacillus subtilis]|nr:hypothetical protein [Bacillus subtilis]